MSGLIAFCNNPECGAVFQHNGIFGGPGSVTGLTFSGVQVGPCPKCGSYGNVPDGIYEYFDEQLSFIKGPKSSIEALLQVEVLLRSLKKEKISKEDVIERVRQIDPSIAENFKKAPSKTDYNQWLNTLIALITVAILCQQTYFKDKPDDVIKDKFIEHLLEENKELKIKKQSGMKPKHKIGRNDACHCGSGLKYKNCHFPKERQNAYYDQSLKKK